jgi:hypothetical protein
MISLAIPTKISIYKLKKTLCKSVVLLLVGALVSILILEGSMPAFANNQDGVIAYVRADKGDEIRLIDPDGGNDRLLWTHGQPDPENVHQVWDLVWSPDGGELAFNSDHENHCSILHSDLYAINSDGSGYRRITQGPACADLAGYPKGTVQVPVTNASTESITSFLYFQGAPVAQQISLPPGGYTVVSFTNVADFGEGWLQYAMEIIGNERSVHVGSAVDVQEGGTVTTAGISVPGFVVPGWEVRSPSWRYDGTQLAFATGFNDIMHITPHPAPLSSGEPLVPLGGDRPSIILRAKWGPTADRGNQILYTGWTIEGDGIYLVTEGSSSAGTLLASFQAFETVQGLAWLPDGSGFVYSLDEYDDFESLGANLFLYTFTSEQSIKITNFLGSFAGDVSISPDGQWIVFERASSLEGLDDGDTDLWLVNIDGDGLQLLVENAGSPAWGLVGTLPPSNGAIEIYLPVVIRLGSN